MDEQKFISNASETNENLSEAQVEIDPGSQVEKRIPRAKKNLTKILCGIIAILGFSLFSTMNAWYKEHQENMRRKDSLHYVAFENKRNREERDFYSKLTADLNYYKFVKTIYEAKDKDFFETITIAYEESIKQNINPWETLSIMWQESGFQQYIVSQITVIKDGQPKKIPCSYGLMQLYYAVWKNEKNLNMSNIFDKRTNIRVGLEIYNYYLGLASRTTSDPKEQKKLALFYYNNGTDPETPNYFYAPTVLKSKYMKWAMNYEPVNLENKPKGISQ